MTAPQRPASNSDARKRAEEKAAETDAPCLDPDCEKPENHDGPCWVFEQCPHEVIHATCGGCNCDCQSCQAINTRIAARVIPPGLAKS